MEINRSQITTAIDWYLLEYRFSKKGMGEEKRIGKSLKLNRMINTIFFITWIV